ncbi:hypothetical protein [Paratractidigestivibacter sp.]|uniref:hypothetical protein n=1 Tax=Paratractidigestivibacter sp. TaxID=2847316 RepID=UPI002ABE9C94|nr:hypothetical protein [Paratractidigestivibacter sp.]
MRRTKPDSDRDGLIKRVADTPLVRRYVTDLAFRGNVSIYQGMVVNFIYVVFRVALGIWYTSVWFISMAVYYLVLGVMRLYLVVSYRRGEQVDQLRCYRRTAWSLFPLNVPMGGMMVLMVLTNSGYTYPGYVIYASALYTFYTLITSIINLVKYRKLGSPILSAAKALNFVAALMSILGLQTAMIAQFSTEGEGYRMLMNALTGGFIWAFVVLIAVYMLRHARALEKGEKEAGAVEQAEEQV